MAVRRWQVHPDVAIPTLQGEVEAVSRETLVEAVLDGIALLDRSGGVLTIVVGRQPTDLPGEMVTTGAVCEWKDRTDARPQPEPAQQVTVQVPGEEELIREMPDPEFSEPPQEETLPLDLEEATNPDGFVPLAEEDDSALEPAERVG